MLIITISNRVISLLHGRIPLLLLMITVHFSHRENQFLISLQWWFKHIQPLWDRKKVLWLCAQTRMDHSQQLTPVTTNSVIPELCFFIVVKATTWFFSCMFYVVLLLLLFFSESSYSTLMLYSTNIAKQQKQRRVSKYEVMNLAVAVRRGLLFLLTLTSFSKFVFVE